MRRSGVLALGAVLMLGGVIGGRGDELSGSVGAGGSPPSGGFSLPDLSADWNWSDLPVKLSASESVSYNSNIFAVPSGSNLLLNGQPHGDFTSTSSYGLSTKANWYGQQFFFDGTFGLIRYLHDSQFDSNIYSFSPGVNWKLTSRCAGAVTGLFTKSPSALTELVGTGVNYATTTAVNETGKCAISNGYSVIFNSGVTKTFNSNPLDALNNANVELISAGIEYAKGPNDLTLLASKSDTNYGNRGAAANILGLANTIVFHTFNLTYVRQINGNLSVTGQVGLVGVSNEFSLALPKTMLPIYSIAGSWQITPKLRLGASASRVVTPPTTVIANAEVAYNTIVSLTYQLTPKVSLSASGTAGYTNIAFTPGLVSTTFTSLSGNTDYYTANAGVTYAMTPFLSAALTATFSERVANHSLTPQDLITASLNYRPY
jgi:hypothetical protein